jgi:hypothetical protein
VGVPSDDTVSTAKIQDAAVTAAKLAAGIPSSFSSLAENAAGTLEGKAVDPLGIREAFNATGSAPVYACRAWVNFNGTGTVAIRASGNVSSITDLGVGDYFVNFTTAMSDANYCANVTGTFANGGLYVQGSTAPTTTELRVASYNSVGSPVDVLYSNVSIFR